MSAIKNKKFSILVIDRPPVKRSTHDDEDRRRKKKLQDEARAQLDYDVPKSELVRMKINYYNGEGNDDLLNIEGGIADALNKIAYEDDRQVWHSSIDQYLVFKDPTWYKIELQFLEPGIIPRDGELEKQGKK